MLNNKPRNSKGELAWALGFIVGLIFLVVGWIMNLFNVAGIDFSELTGIDILYVVGVFIPFIGAITGWFF